MGDFRDFYKYTALGNDYLVIDPRKFSRVLTPEDIQRICHRHFGVGSDGILLGPFMKRKGNEIEISLKIFNPDGSEAEKSGNGLRIFARYLKDASYVTTTSFSLQTLGGQVMVEYLDQKGHRIKIHMGKRNFKSESVPVLSGLEETVNFPLNLNGQVYHVTCVSMGNPHCVILLPEGVSVPTPELAKDLGPLVENHLLFPRRINMQLLKVLNRQKIVIEIWERGAGYTLASGSSSCAAAAVAHRLGLIDSQVKVQMPGGELEIDLEEKGGVWMTGPVLGIGSGYFAEDFFPSLPEEV